MVACSCKQCSCSPWHDIITGATANIDVGNQTITNRRMETTVYAIVQLFIKKGRITKGKHKLNHQGTTNYYNQCVLSLG